MELTHLPPDWVEILNEMAFARAPLGSDDERFESVLVNLRSWHEFESGYSVNAAELQELDNLKFLIDEIENAYASGEPAADLEFLAPRLFQIVRLMESIQDLRARAHYSGQPLVNDLVLAGAAFIEGRAEERALPDRVERLRVWKDQLWLGYEEFAPGLGEQACQDLERGFAMIEEGLDEIEQAESLKNPAQLKPSLARLVDGASLLKYLVEFRFRSLEALSGQYPRWEAIPEVGAQLERGIDRLSQLDPAARPAAWEEQIRPLLLELAFWWGQNRDSLPLPAEFVQAWIAEVEELLGVLVHFDSATLAGSPSELTDVEGLFDQLAGGFAEARDKLVPVQHLRGGQAGLYYEVINGLLRNTQPVFAAAEVFNNAEPPAGWQAVVDDIINYTKSGQRELLHQAREKLWTLVPAPDDGAGPESWTCPFCQHETPLGQTVCQHCGGGSSVSREVASWDA